MSVDGYITGRDPGAGRADPRHQRFEDAVVAAREAAGVTEALKAGLVDEVVLHQVPVLLGGGRPFFQALPEHVRLRLVEAVPGPGVTHLHYEVER